MFVLDHKGMGSGTISRITQQDHQQQDIFVLRIRSLENLEATQFTQLEDMDSEFSTVWNQEEIHVLVILAQILQLKQT